jgi:hypothetical protein
MFKTRDISQTARLIRRCVFGCHEPSHVVPSTRVCVKCHRFRHRGHRRSGELVQIELAVSVAAFKGRKKQGSGNACLVVDHVQYLVLITLQVTSHILSIEVSLIILQRVGGSSSSIAGRDNWARIFEGPCSDTGTSQDQTALKVSTR